jgi:uncharacterized protein (DUF983 family)
MTDIAPSDGFSGPPLPLDRPKRSAFEAMTRGARGKCPACGAGRLFARYLKVADHCPNCGEALHHHRADDAPPYFTILIVGHLIVPLMLTAEILVRPPLWLHALIWLPLTTLLCLALLPIVKGTIVGLQWALYMHGFDPDEADGAPPSPFGKV